MTRKANQPYYSLRPQRLESYPWTRTSARPRIICGVTLCFVAIMTPIRLAAEAARVATEVSVSRVVGSSRLLTRGMRVDALFFRQVGERDPLTTRQLLLALRNVEVQYSSASPNFARDGYPILASLWLTRGQAQSVDALPPAVVELDVASTPKGSRSAPASSSVSAPPQAGRNKRGDDPIYGYDPYAPEAAENRGLFISPSSSDNIFVRILRYLIWPIFGLLIIKTLAGTIRSSRRSRRSDAYIHGRRGANS